MLNINIISIFFFKFILYINFFFVFICGVILLLNNLHGNISAIKERFGSNFVKNLLILNIFVNIFIGFLMFYSLVNLFKNNLINNITFNIKIKMLNKTDMVSGYYLDFDLFNLLFFILSLFVAFISLLALDTRLYSSKLIFLVLCNVLVLVIFLFSFTNNYILFFIFYEMLLIPSFFFVYRISPAKTAIQSSIYFVMWTQIGSFLVFLAVVLCFILTNTPLFSGLYLFKFTESEQIIIYTLLFFGFGIKIPVWPFHYWITKTHVDAPTGFSIFLSGFLVKTALFGFYKFSIYLGFLNNSVIFSTICLLGILDASMKMWGQTDLKKLVAYATIQEMGLVFLTVCFGDTTSLIGGFIFSVTHAFLSSIFFFLVDTVSRRFYTRNITEINGILHLTPNLGISILISCVLYSGLPGTLKFVSEVYIYSGLIDITPVSTIVILFVSNFLGLIGFTKVWFNLVFGTTSIDKKPVVNDLSIKEIYSLFLCFVGLFLWSIVLPIYL